MKRNRERMLKRVLHDWVKPGLEHSLYHVARLELGLKETPGAIEHPWKLCVDGTSTQPVTWPSGTPISEVFHRFNDTLLLLGEPGSGKTTLLLELARDLITEAKQHHEKPVPVIFNLSSWAVQRLPLAEWLADELHRQFGVNKNTTRFLIKNHDVLPLLDGLDEVAREYREACVEAINTFRTEHGLLPLALCSRAEEYGALAKKLHLPAAVTIQPLEFEQVDRYLAQAGAPLERVRKLITEDQTLQDLLDTPLMLSIMQLAFSGSKDAAKALETGTLEERRKNLFNTYIERMFTRRDSTSYTPEQTIAWLSRLARSMKERDQSLFYLEQLQPSLLPNNLKIMHKIVSPITSGIFVGVLVGTISWLINMPVLSLLGFGMGFGLSVGLYRGLLTTGNIKLAEGNLEPWRWLKTLNLLNFFKNFLFVLLISALGGVFGGQFGGILSAMLIVLIFWLMKNNTIFQEMSERMVPNEGIYRSLKNALFVGLAFGMTCGLGSGLLLYELYNLLFQSELNVERLRNIILMVGMNYGIGFGIFGGMIFGGYACIQHGVLRLLLWLNGFAPLRYVRFLDHAAALLFLRKAGGGYIFVHRMIMEHFAELKPLAVLHAKQNNPEPIDALRAARRGDAAITSSVENLLNDLPAKD